MCKFSEINDTIYLLLQVRDAANVNAWRLCLAVAKRWSGVLGSVSGSVIS